MLGDFINHIAYYEHSNPVSSLSLSPFSRWWLEDSFVLIVPHLAQGQTLDASNLEFGTRLNSRGLFSNPWRVSSYSRHEGCEKMSDHDAGRWHFRKTLTATVNWMGILGSFHEHLMCGYQDGSWHVWWPVPVAPPKPECLLQGHMDYRWLRPFLQDPGQHSSWLGLLSFMLELTLGG